MKQKLNAKLNHNIKSSPSLYLSSIGPNSKRGREWERERDRMQQEQATSSRSSSSGLQMETKEGMESDDEVRRVPDFASGAGDPAGPSASGGGAGAPATSTSQAGQRKRGKSPADKEHKRLKRLLRNRVSAQQARERKKAYLNDLEEKVKELERRNLELEERLSTLQNENQMLRQILKNTTVNRRGSSGSNGESLA